MIIGKVALRSPTIVQPLEVILLVKEVSLWNITIHKSEMKASFCLRTMQHDHPTLCTNARLANFTEESTKISARSNCVIGKKTFYSFSMFFIETYFIWNLKHHQLIYTKFINISTFNWKHSKKIQMQKMFYVGNIYVLVLRTLKCDNWSLYWISIEAHKTFVIWYGSKKFS